MEEEGYDACGDVENLNRIANRGRIGIEEVSAEVEGVGEAGFFAQVLERQVGRAVQGKPTDTPHIRGAGVDGNGRRPRDYETAGKAARVKIEGKNAWRAVGRVQRQDGSLCRCAEKHQPAKHQAEKFHFHLLKPL